MPWPLLLGVWQHVFTNVNGVFPGSIELVRSHGRYTGIAVLLLGAPEAAHRFPTWTTSPANTHQRALGKGGYG